jgi:membrane-associated phospholipid phosphatase
MEVLNNANFILTGIARSYPILFLFSSTFYALINEKTIGFTITGLGLLDIILNTIFKSISEIIYNYRDTPLKDGKCDTFWLRPPEYTGVGASKLIAYPLIKECGLYNKCQSQLPSKIITPIDRTICRENLGIGMPSGHAQFATSMTLVMLLILWAKKHTLVYQILGTIFIVGFSFLSIINRVVINCHTVLQVVIGSWIGYLLGIAYYYFTNYLYGNNPDEMVQIDTMWKHLLLWAYPIIGLFIILGILFFES